MNRKENTNGLSGLRTLSLAITMAVLFLCAPVRAQLPGQDSIADIVKRFNEELLPLEMPGMTLDSAKYTDKRITYHFTYSNQAATHEEMKSLCDNITDRELIDMVGAYAQAPLMRQLLEMCADQGVSMRYIYTNKSNRRQCRLDISLDIIRRSLQVPVAPIPGDILPLPDLVASLNEGLPFSMQGMTLHHAELSDGVLNFVYHIDESLFTMKEMREACQAATESDRMNILAGITTINPYFSMVLAACAKEYVPLRQTYISTVDRSTCSLTIGSVTIKNFLQN